MVTVQQEEITLDDLERFLKWKIGEEGEGFVVDVLSSET